MAFNDTRAHAFAEYVLPGLLRDLRRQKLYMARLSRTKLTQVLGGSNLWPQHIETIRRAALEHGVGLANLGREFFFFDVEQIEEFAKDFSKTTSVVASTDYFAKLYGSDAADEDWDSFDFLRGKK